MNRLALLAGPPLLAAMALCACDVSRAVIEPEHARCHEQPLEAGPAVDVLFVVDSSSSMLPNQAHLIRSFPGLLDALRLPRLGGDLPDLRVGVISTDLGARGLAGDCKPFPGDGGRLRRLTGVMRAERPWLEYRMGQTNITGPIGFGAARLLGAAFSHLANLGAAGCSYEQPLEAARRALDPALKVNPGFLRPHALLAVVFITNEDDCSVARPETFPFEDAPGFASIHRCFDMAVRCHCPAADLCSVSPQRPCTGCTLRSSGPLWPVSRYVQFFRTLKRAPDGRPAPSRVVLAALAGSTTKVSVCKGPGGDTRLRNTCSGTTSLAYPAFRLRAVVDALSAEAPPPVHPAVPTVGVAQQLDTFSDICTDDFRHALRQVGQRITVGLSLMCPD